MIIQLAFPSFVLFIRFVEPHSFENAEAYFQESLSFDIHEISFDVHLKYVGLASIIQRNRSDVMLKSFNSIMSSSSFDATIAVCNERPLKQNMSIVIIQMMHYAVPEVSCEYFPHFRISNYEATGNCLRRPEGWYI